MIKISSEYSAQPYAQKPNPMLKKAIVYLDRELGLKKEAKVAEQCCGALRHLKLMQESYGYIVLVDTREQFGIKRIIDGSKTTIPDYVSNLRLPNKQIVLMNNVEFSTTSLALDAIFNMCAFDVVLPETRVEMLGAAKRNLKEGGNLILIIPRNDSSILCRCKKDNQYSDGYYFRHHGNTYTFYTNFRSYESLVEVIKDFGFILVEDLSIYRHVCLIFTLKGDDI